jgi:hypothetical protein
VLCLTAAELMSADAMRSGSAVHGAPAMHKSGAFYAQADETSATNH